jgi:flagellar hook-length control protein FliK
MSVDMQFFLLNAETSVDSGKKSDRAAHSKEEDTGFSTLFDGELAGQVSEKQAGSAGKLSTGQEVAAEELLTVDLIEKLRHQANATNGVTSVEALPSDSAAKLDLPQSSEIQMLPLSEESAHFDALELSLPETDSPWLQLISAAEQYAADLAILDGAAAKENQLEPLNHLQGVDSSYLVKWQSSQGGDLDPTFTAQSALVDLSQRDLLLKGDLPVERSVLDMGVLSQQIEAAPDVAKMKTDANLAESATEPQVMLRAETLLKQTSTETATAVTVGVEAAAIQPIDQTLLTAPSEPLMVNAAEQPQLLAADKGVEEAEPLTKTPIATSSIVQKQISTDLQTSVQQSVQPQHQLPSDAVTQPQAAVLTEQDPHLAVSAQSANNLAPQTFAEHQKSANAAEALAQKQQLKADFATGAESQQGQQQQQSRHESAAASLQAALPDTQNQPILNSTFDKTLLATSLNTTQGASSSVQQLHAQQSHAASQTASLKAADAQLATLNLLEPQAAVQLKDRVMYQVQQKIQTAEIRLAPEDLGSVQIKVNLQQDQLSVQFVVQQPQAKEALEQQMPRLKELLQQQGLELADSQVSQQQQQQSGEKQQRAGSQMRFGNELAEDSLPQQAIIRSSDRVVDYYA